MADKDEKEQDEFKTGLARFNHLYGFITQVCQMFDMEMQKFSVYAKFLIKMILKGKIEKITVDDVDIQALLGHENLNTTAIYTKPHQHSLRAAVESLCD